MGRTRPLLQQIIMGVKINLAKWSDALLETSNCFSLILLPPPHSLRAANDAVAGAGVSPGEEGLGGCPRGASAPSGPSSSPRAGLSRGSHTSSRAPTLASLPVTAWRPPPALCSTRRRASFLHDPATGLACWERRGDSFSLHPDPLPCVFSAGEPRPLAAQAQRHTEVVKRGRHAMHAD